MKGEEGEGIVIVLFLGIVIVLFLGIVIFSNT